jgi:acetate kinase
VRVLVVNSGSSSLKIRLLEGDAAISAQDLSSSSDEDVRAQLGSLKDAGVDAVGHRVVHGGTLFSDAAVITGEVEEAIRSLTPLAPLHQARSLSGIESARSVFPGVPHVACFDTAFHAQMPDAAATYAVPQEWRGRYGVRRFGFHGLSHAYAARRCTEMMDRPIGDIRIVTCHLGAGASLAAVSGGVSVDTTMGFTPLEGLVMATRSGSIDPALPLWLLRQTRLSPKEVEDALEHGSGLVGLAGTADMRVVLDRASAGDRGAALARDVYLRRLRAGIGEMATAMEGLDALVFTGGVGERSPVIRAEATRGLGFLGIEVDDRRNDTPAGDSEITQTGAPVRSFVVSAREDLEIARQTRHLLGAD